MTPHSWRFVRTGGFDQVVLETSADLRNLATLDQKLWVALACPVRGNELDETTLALIDADEDGRIRAPELLAAVAWMDRVLVDLSAVLESEDGLALANIADDTIRSSAREILAGRGKPDDVVITVADTSVATEVLNAMPFNGDGVVPASAATDATVAQVILDIVETLGGVTDRNGELGVDATHLVSFWSALEGYEAWWKQAEESEDTVVPLGDATAPAVEAYAAVRPKIEDFFTRCDLAAFDARAQAHLAGPEAQWGEIAGRTLSTADADVRAFPLSRIEAGRDLPLQEGINPAWVREMAALVEQAVTPLLGAQVTLTRGQWAELKSRFAAYEAWLVDKAGIEVEPLGIERIRGLLASDLRGAVEALIAQDEARRPEADALLDVDRAARYRRDLFTLVHNFVSFRNFYDPKRKAMFQAGTLYLDGRSCDLVLRVDDITAHSATADQSYVYLAYCVCTRKGSSETMNIAAAFTNGDSDFLAVGRNGLLYDRKGHDWDVTITKVVEQPISIRQAFWAPYKRLVRFISTQAENFAAGQEAASSAQLTTDVGKHAFDIGKFAGIFAAVGLALGFMVSTATMVVAGFLSLRPWQMPVAALGVVLLISGPSMLVAAFKLSRRNLAPVLDANGWAINTRARINVPFGTTLTKIAELPDGAHRQLTDPYAENGRPWKLYGLLVVLLFVAAVVWDVGLPDGLSEWMVEQVKEVSGPTAGDVP